MPKRHGVVAARIALAVALITASGCGGDGDGPQSSQWELTFSDEFDRAAGAGVDTSKWIYDIGTAYPGGLPDWGAGEVAYMTDDPANVSHDGRGHLAITPLRGSGMPEWTSGRIETQRADFQPPTGGALAIEASIQQPNVSGDAAAGYWPAFWSIGAPYRGNYQNWPGVGEIAFLESINGRSSVWGTLHCGTLEPPNPCNEYVGLSSGEVPCPGCLTGFHTYRAELDNSVTPEEIRWYLDGRNYFTVRSNEVDEATWANATDHGFILILNVAMGGGFPAAFGGGPTEATVSGVPMLIDYVRVYERHS